MIALCVLQATWSRLLLPKQFPVTLIRDSGKDTEEYSAENLDKEIEQPITKDNENKNFQTT